MKLKPITKTQKQIIFFLFKFRFLTVNQLQKYFNHKDSHRIKEWLKDLKDKKYIAAVVDSRDITKPFVYCLSGGARSILKEDEKCDESFLNRLYKEKNLTEIFRNHCLNILDIYLFFLSQKEKDTKLHFLTPQELTGCDYLPEDLDAYIAVEGKNDTSRYFLEVFDEYKKSAGQGRFAVRKYIKFCEDGAWQANTDNSPFPSILFVQPDERRKKHIFHYGKAKLEKTFEDISLFQTTMDTIKFSKGKTNIWQKIE
ncbi:replication-relaxation family protein [Candidatus Daviesbacteria bacterium]|nr:replication-relaxation family protein [Candidatus Daviesbacteria bacterium]